jgi:acyl-CoA thioesterase I
MRRLLFCLLICCLPLSPSSADDTTVIAAFGDSLFAGLGVSPEDSFPYQLDTRLKMDGYNVNTMNFGYSGDTTADGVSRVDMMIRHGPDLVLVELGANDMLRGATPESVRKNLGTILSRIHDARIKMLVIGQKAPLAYGSQYSKSYDSIFCDLAKEYDAPCYPFFLKAAFNNPDLMQPDGIHPNAKGVKAILDDIYPIIAPMIKKR